MPRSLPTPQAGFSRQCGPWHNGHAWPRRHRQCRVLGGLKSCTAEAHEGCCHDGRQRRPPAQASWPAKTVTRREREANRNCRVCRGSKLLTLTLARGTSRPGAWLPRPSYSRPSNAYGAMMDPEDRRVIVGVGVDLDTAAASQSTQNKKTSNTVVRATRNHGRSYMGGKGSFRGGWLAGL